MKVEKRFKEGGILRGSYTWAKLLSESDTLSSWLEARHTVGGVQDPGNLRLDKSLASFSVAHRLVASYVLDLPVGRGKRVLGNVGGFADRIVSGWGLSGVSTFQSGLPLAFTTASNLTNSLGGGSRPNVVSGNKAVDGSAQSRLGQWFNTQAFASPAAFTYGNESRTDPTLRAASIANWNFTIVEKTEIRERWKLEFRREFFNLFNRVQFADPNTPSATHSSGL
jgi:hypothetical protein